VLSAHVCSWHTTAGSITPPRLTASMTPAWLDARGGGRFRQVVLQRGVPPQQGMQHHLRYRGRCGASHPPAGCTGCCRSARRAAHRHVQPPRARSTRAAASWRWRRPRGASKRVVPSS
jgi:hypothetical protein